MMISLGIDIPIQKVIVQPQEKREEPIKAMPQEKPSEELIKAIAERDMFERLYREMLEKLIGGKVAV